MLSYFIISAISASQLSLRPDNEFDSQAQGLFDIKYVFNGEEVPFSYNKQGTQVQLKVKGGNSYLITRNNNDPHEDIVVSTQLDKLNDDVASIKFIVKNTGSQRKTISLGTYTQFQIRNDGNVYVKNLNGNPRSFYLYYPSASRDSWKKLIFRLSDPQQLKYRDLTPQYTPPSNFYFGNIDSSSDKFFMKFSDPDNFYDYDSSSSMIHLSYSWEDITIEQGSLVVLGIHFLYQWESEVQLIPDKLVYSFSSGDEIYVGAQIVLQKQNRRYYPQFRTPGGTWVGDQGDSSFSTNRDIERWGFKSIPANPGRYNYELRFHDPYYTSTSSVETIEITLSDKPNLTVQYNINQNMKYDSTNDSIRFEVIVQSISVTYVYYQIFTNGLMRNEFNDTCHLTPEVSSQSISKNIPLTGLERGEYYIVVKAVNEFGLEANKSYTTPTFKIGDNTKIISWIFDKSVYANGDDMIITGEFADKDPDEILTFVVKFGNSVTEYKSSQVNSSETSEFTITIKGGPKITGDNVICTLIARDINNRDVASDTKTVHISEAPTLTVNPRNTGSVFDYNTTLVFDLTISDDDSRGDIKWYFDNDKDTIYSIQYSADNGVFTDPLTVKLSDYNIVYKNQKYKMVIYAVDYNNIKSNEVPFSFNVLSKPIINGIELKQRGEPGEQTYIKVLFDDYDTDKTLHLYADYGSHTDHLIFKTSNGQPDQTLRTVYTFPSQFKGNVNFFLSSRSDLKTIPSSSNSDSEPKTLEIVSTDVPQISAQWPELYIFETGESIKFNLTVQDDNSGSIKYTITGNDFNRNIESNPNRYEFSSSGSITYPVTIPIPADCKYHRDYSGYYLQVQCTDDYNVSSSPLLFKFHIKNKIVLNKVTVVPNLVRPDVNKQVNLTAYFKNVDEERNIVMWATFGDNAPSPLTDISTVGDNEVLSYVTDVPDDSALNYPVSVWLEDDFDESRDPRNGNTSVITVFINITKAPAMTSTCLPGIAYGKDDKIKISLEVIDDTNGMIEFKIDNEVINQQLHYNTTNGVAQLSTEIDIPAKYKTFGTHSISYYPVDEFGLRPTTNDSITTCSFVYKNKPLLQALKLNKTVADDDDPIAVSGNLVDYDLGKKLFIYQKLGTHDPILLGEIVSKGGSPQPFTYIIQKLKGVPSGQTSIEIIACDSNETIDASRLDRNAISDPFPLSIYMANDPELVVIFPEENVFGTSDKIQIKVNITAEIQGTVYLYDYKIAADYDYIDNAVDHASYNSSCLVTLTYNTSPYSYSTQKLYIKAIGNNGTKSNVYSKSFYIRDAPQLNSIAFTKDAAAPGDYLSATYYIYNEQGGTFYLFVKIGNNIQSVQKNLWSYTGYLTPTFYFQLNLSQKTGATTFTFWVQNTPNVVYPPEKNSKSAEFTRTIYITKAPDVDFNYPQEKYYGYDDTFQCNAVIKDDTRGNILLKVDGNVIKNETYTSNNQLTTKSFTFNIPKTVTYRNKQTYSYYYGYQYSNDFSVTMSVVDEYGMSTEKTQTFKLVNKPKVTAVSVSKDLILQDQTFLSVRINYSDVDYGKTLYFWVYFDDVKSSQYRSVTSYGQPNSQEFSFDIPSDKKAGLHTISVKVADVSSTYYTSNRNSFSNIESIPVRVTFRPSITLDEISNDYISKGQNLRLTGSLSFDTTTFCKIVVSFGSIQTKPTLIDKSSLIDGKYDITATVPDGLSFGTTTMTVSAIDGNLIQSSNSGSKTFTYKNKPKIHDFSMLTDYFSTEGTASFNLLLDDQDDGKDIYVWMQIGDEDPMNVYWTQSNGKDNQLLEISEMIYTEMSGLTNVQFYVTDTYDEYAEGLSISNVLSQQIVFSYTPSFQVTYPSDFYYHTNEVIPISYTCQDDGDVTLYVTVNGESIDSMKETLSPNNQMISGTKNINLTADIFQYGYSEINVYVVDKYGFKSDDQLFYISIINPPVIDSITISKNYALQGDIIEFDGTFTDIDKTKDLYFYVQLGDKAVEESSLNVQSTGGKGQKFSFGLKINESETIGKKKIKVWLSSNYNPNIVYNAAYANSKVFEFDFEVTYKPSILLQPLVKTAYNDGEKISIRGSVTANSNIFIKFKIDNIELNVTNEIQVIENPQEFEVKLQIPENFKYGKHNLNAYAVDANGLSTGLTHIEFNIQNPPRILSISLVSDSVTAGGKAKVRGTFKDPDVGNHITFLAGIDLEVKTEVYEIVSDSSVQEFEFEISIPSNIELGDHDLEIVARDPDNLESAPAELTFTVVKGSSGNGGDSDSSNANSNNANKKKKATNSGLIAGIVIVALVLVVLIVLLVVLLIKKGSSNNAHESDSETENEDLEERETQIATSIPMEEATRDNPLFSASEVANDNDPFSDEFEEQDHVD